MEFNLIIIKDKTDKVQVAAVLRDLAKKPQTWKSLTFPLLLWLLIFNSTRV